MTKQFPCPFLGSEVELTQEREQHIAETHPGTLPDYLDQLAETLISPDQVRFSARDERALLFSKWFTTIRTGRYLVVVVVSDTDPKRYWVITTYTARRLSGGKVVWQTEN
ncbi:MAG: PBECR2 nuclease fold domain-containing protein [Cyanobacteria bacterium J06638_6]